MELYKKSTLEFTDNTPEEFAAFMRRDRENAGKVFRSMGVKPSTAPSS